MYKEQEAKKREEEARQQPKKSVYMKSIENEISFHVPFSFRSGKRMVLTVMMDNLEMLNQVHQAHYRTLRLHHRPTSQILIQVHR